MKRKPNPKKSKTKTESKAIKPQIAPVLAETILKNEESKAPLPIFTREKEVNSIKTFLKDPEKSILLLIGQTGVGKTYIVQQILKESKVKWLYLNAFKYSEDDKKEVEDLFDCAEEEKWC